MKNLIILKGRKGGSLPPETASCYSVFNPIPHPDAFIREDFGRSYSTFLDWFNGWATRYPNIYGNTFKLGVCGFDNSILFNGQQTLYVTGDNGSNHVNMFAGMNNPPPNHLYSRKVWMRSMMYIGTGITSASSQIYLGALVFLGQPPYPDPRYTAYFPSDVVYVPQDWEVGLPGFLSYGYDDFNSPRPIGTVPLTSIEGRWISVVQYAELGVASRLAVWLDGQKIIDSRRTDIDFSDLYFGTIQLAFGKDGGAGIKLNYGLVEYLNGETFPDPYCLLMKDGCQAATDGTIHNSGLSGHQDIGFDWAGYNIGRDGYEKFHTDANNPPYIIHPPYYSFTDYERDYWGGTGTSQAPVYRNTIGHTDDNGGHKSVKAVRLGGEVLNNYGYLWGFQNDGDSLTQIATTGDWWWRWRGKFSGGFAPFKVVPVDYIDTNEFWLLDTYGTGNVSLGAGAGYKSKGVNVSIQFNNFDYPFIGNGNLFVAIETKSRNGGSMLYNNVQNRIAQAGWLFSGISKEIVMHMREASDLSGYAVTIWLGDAFKNNLQIAFNAIVPWPILVSGVEPQLGTFYEFQNIGVGELAVGSYKCYEYLEWEFAREANFSNPFALATPFPSVSAYTPPVPTVTVVISPYSAYPDGGEGAWLFPDPDALQEYVFNTALKKVSMRVVTYYSGVTFKLSAYTNSGYLITSTTVAGGSQTFLDIAVLSNTYNITKVVLERVSGSAFYNYVKLLYVTKFYGGDIEWLKVSA